MFTNLLYGFYILGTLFFLALFLIIIKSHITAFFEPVFVPLSADILKRVVTALELSENSVLYDLGSGDGRVLLECFRDEPRGRYVGIEKNILPLAISALRLRKAKKVGRVEQRRQDFFRTDLGQATHVFVYLSDKAMQKLYHKLRRELRPGTRVVSCDFWFDEMHPKQVIDLGRKEKWSCHKLYVYEF